MGSAPIDYVFSSIVTGGFKYQGSTPSPAPASGEGGDDGDKGKDDGGGGGGGEKKSLTPVWPAMFPAYAPQFAQAPPDLLKADNNGKGDAKAKDEGGKGKEDEAPDKDSGGGKYGGETAGAGAGDAAPAAEAPVDDKLKHRLLVINKNPMGVNSYWVG